MAIPEPAPSTRRRSLLLLFLLLSLIGSIGLAYSIMMWKNRNIQRPLDFAFRIPKGFVHDKAPDGLAFDPILSLRGQVQGNERRLFVFHGQIDTFDDPANPLRGEVLGFYRQLFAAEPEDPIPAVLDGQPALNAWGILPGEASFAILRGTIVNKRQFVAIVYRGEGEPLIDDQRIFNAFAGPSFNIITNQPPEKK